MTALQQSPPMPRLLERRDCSPRSSSKGFCAQRSFRAPKLRRRSPNSGSTKRCSNWVVVDHSELVGTGTIAYFGRKGRFEFVVHDAGIGVLASLRSNPEQSDLRDSGTALESALAEGVSRYEENGHGYGFRPLFVGLVNLAQLIRFRSGDHGRVIFREGSGIRSQTVQLSPCAGLSCTVQCEIG